MSIATTVAAMQALHRAVAGIKSAPLAFPANLSTATLPIVLTWPGEANWNLHTLDMSRQERTYEVRCYVDPVAQDKAGPENPYVRCVALLELFGQLYLGHTTLGGLVDTMRVVSDSGIMAGGDLTWAGIPYWGFTYRVSIVEKSPSPLDEEKGAVVSIPVNSNWLTPANAWTDIQAATGWAYPTVAGSMLLVTLWEGTGDPDDYALLNLSAGGTVDYNSVFASAPTGGIAEVIGAAYTA